MSHLLKKKSKVQVERKDRVTYEAYDFLKRPRNSSNIGKTAGTNP